MQGIPHVPEEVGAASKVRSVSMVSPVSDPIVAERAGTSGSVRVKRL